MKKTLILSIALALSGVSFAAAAHDGAHGFIRANIGQSDSEFDVDGLGEGSENDTSATFGGGYWFNSNFAIEGHIGTLYNKQLTDDLDFDVVTWGLGVAAKKNFGPDNTGFFIGGRAGIARMTAQVRNDLDIEEDESSNKPYYGASVGYDFNENWGLSLNWDQYRGDFDGFDIDSQVVSVGGEYRF